MILFTSVIYTTYMLHILGNISNMQYIIFASQWGLILTTFSYMQFIFQSIWFYICNIYYSCIPLVLFHSIFYTLDLYFSVWVFWKEYNFLIYHKIFITFKISYYNTNSTSYPFRFDLWSIIHKIGWVFNRMA